MAGAAGDAWARWLDVVARFAWPIVLTVWFAWNSWQRITFFLERTFPVGIDATIYYRGAQAWLQGDDPWSAAVKVSGTTFHYAGTPVTTILFAPFTLLDEQLFMAGAVAASVLAAAYVVWRLRLGWYWLLFPPLAEGVFAANPQVVLLALLLVGWGPASALATMLKAYAFVPLVGEGRWRHIVLAVAANAVTIILAQDLWRSWIAKAGVVDGRLLRDRSGGSPPLDTGRCSPCSSSRCSCWRSVTGAPLVGSRCPRYGPPRSSTTRRWRCRR